MLLHSCHRNSTCERGSEVRVAILSQDEADELLAVSKEIVSREPIFFDDKIEIELISKSKSKVERFIVNFQRDPAKIAYRNYHLRCRGALGLARLDLDGPSHRNPDRKEVSGRHLHLYRKGFDLKWASEVSDSEHFKNLDDAYETLIDFLKYINVSKLPNFRRGFIP